MTPWYTKNLGDGMMASVPENEIKEAFLRLFESTGKPHDMAVFTRGESEGLLAGDEESWSVLFPGGW